MNKKIKIDGITHDCHIRQQQNEFVCTIKKHGDFYGKYYKNCLDNVILQLTAKKLIAEWQ